MARIINTATVLPTDITNQWTRDQVYNGIDVLATLQVINTIKPQLDAVTGATYDFSRSLQGPALEMRLRGIRIDHVRKAEVLDELHDRYEFLERNLERIVLEGVGMPKFNARSHADLQELFYNRLGIPPIRKQGRPTTDRNAREKLAGYLLAKPIVSHLNTMADVQKKISVLRTGIDPDGRIRTSYNIAGTDTGRFSSSFSEFGTGGNLQNIEESIRSVLIADPGMKWAKCDAKSGESFVVGAIEWNLFNDEKYLSACESGDPHTAVARICWPNMAWSGDIKRDKDLAEQPYYRHYSYRFMCKKLGHGSNYGGKPDTLAAQSKLPVPVVIAFQPKYFEAFPAHLLWQNHVERTLRTTGTLTSLTGRRRWFFGRRNDPSTLRAAIAYDPQGSLADIVNRAMLNIWRKNYVSILLQDHDALTFQYPEAMEDEIIPRIMKDLIVPVTLKNGRTLAIPYDVKCGWNRGDYNAKTNPDGLRDYYPGDGGRKRTPETGILDRIIARTPKGITRIQS